MRHSRLQNQILKHWQDNYPQMVTDLRQTGTLESTLCRAESRAVDLLYDYLMRRKLKYLDAREPAMQEMPVTDLEPEPAPSRDFRITKAHRIGEGSLTHKARDNIEAIRTLKTLESEGRDATEEEKAKIARYVGWGAMSGAFDWYPSDELNQTAKDIKAILTEDEYDSARASTPNAHFTSALVINSVWNVCNGSD